MNPGGGGPSDRPLCPCHGLPSDRDGHGRYHCAEKRRARQATRYRDNPLAANYARTRRALVARIRLKRRRIDELERQLEEEITRGTGPGGRCQDDPDADTAEALPGG